MQNPAPMLQGIRVIDLTSVIFGPYCTQMLAEMGADVIKVEPPEGDIFRRAGLPARTPGMGPCHMVLNRGKRSLVLDLKAPADHALMQALLATADVFIHNIRAPAITALGFGPEQICAANPGLVYVHCAGFGSPGPYAGLQAYDDVIQAASGATSLAGRADGGAAPRYMPSTVADKVAGLYAANATLAAIIHRLRTGEGQRVEVPMFECFTQFLYEEHLFGGVFDPPTGPIGYPRQLDPHRQPYPTQNGHISIVPYTPDSIAACFDVLGDPAFLTQPALADPVLRMQNISRIYQRIAELTPARTTEAWLPLLHAARIPAMAVRDMADILDDPHLRQTGFFAPETHPTEGGTITMQPPVRFSAQQPPKLRPAPVLGQHSAEIRQEMQT